MSERYTETAIHFDVERLPALLARSLPPGPLALADLGCGDGPLFAALVREGVIDATRPVYAVDLEAARLARVSARFPWIRDRRSVGGLGPGDSPTARSTPSISTMVMEHVPDEQAYLAEIRRVLRPGGRAYVTTVYKKRWAWYFRKRDGESVLDTSHLREYTDLRAFRALVTSVGTPDRRARTPTGSGSRSSTRSCFASAAASRRIAACSVCSGRQGADPRLLQPRSRRRELTTDGVASGR